MLTGFEPACRLFVSEILRDNGYNTLAVGKWHLVPKSDQTQVDPFNRWPVGWGFEHYFGFLGGATDQNRPILWEGTSKVEKAYNDPRLLSELINGYKQDTFEGVSLPPVSTILKHLMYITGNTTKSTVQEPFTKMEGRQVPRMRKVNHSVRINGSCLNWMRIFMSVLTLPKESAETGRAEKIF